MVTLGKISRQIRTEILDLVQNAKSGHITSSFSIVEILVFLFYKHLGSLGTAESRRDHLVLSKGHGVPALYAVLRNVGLLSSEEFASFRRIGSRLQGHPDRVRLSLVEASTGSLGQGLSIAVGLGLAARLRRDDLNVYCVVSDGELQEGQSWEAILSAGHFRLGNLYMIIDYNGFQSSGATEDIVKLAPLDAKLRAFGWCVVHSDGHSFDSLDASFSALSKSSLPKALVANTIKGKGVPFLEGNNFYHGRILTSEEEQEARRCLEREPI